MESVIEIKNSSTVTTTSSKMEDLPVVVHRLLLDTSSDRDAEVVSILRKKVRSTVFIKNKQKASRVRSENQEELIDILDQLKLFLQSENADVDAWSKAIQSDFGPKNEVVDWIIILNLLTDPSKEKAVYALLRNQIKSGLFRENPLMEKFETYHWATEEHLDLIIKLATTFCKCDNHMFSKFGSDLYMNLYYNFDLVVKQIVVESLLKHVACFKSSKHDCTVELLADLTKGKLVQVVPSVDYVDIIDNLDCLALPKVRLVYSSLSALSCTGCREGKRLQKTLRAAVKKQLTHSSLKYKRIGIVGGLMLVKHLGTHDHNFNKKRLRKTLSLLKFLHDAVQKDTIALAFFYDDVASMLLDSQLERDVMMWITDNVNSFWENYIVDFYEFERELLQFGLDPDICRCAVNLYPLLEHEKKPISQLTFIPQLRLLHICESIYDNGCMENIGALAFCPIVLFPMKKIDHFVNLDIGEKNIICSALFYTLNFFREVINTFSNQNDSDFIRYVLLRLKTITHLENVLKKCLESNLGFRPPLAHFNVDEKVSSFSLKRKINITDTQTNKKWKNVDTSADVITQIFPCPSKFDVTKAVKKSEKCTSPVIELSQYAPYFRELDFWVFNLLENKMNLQNSTTDSDPKEGYLSPPESIFLLEDLKAKLKFLLRSTSEDHNGLANDYSSFTNLSLMKPLQVFDQSVALIPDLCSHLESASLYFHKSMADTMDNTESPTESSSVIASCLKLILECLTLIFSWKELDQYQEVQHAAVRYLAKRRFSFSNKSRKNIDRGKSQFRSQRDFSWLSSKSDESQSSSEDNDSQSTSECDDSQLNSDDDDALQNIDDCVARALDYIMKISESVPNFSCAVIILSLGEKISACNNTDANRNTLSEIAEQFLKRPWFSNGGIAECGTKHSQDLQRVLTLSLEFNFDTFKLLQTLTTVALREILESRVESKTYLTMTRSTFALYYRVMFTTLVKEAKINANDKSDDIVVLRRWTLAMGIFHDLVKTVNVFGNQTNFICCIKNSRNFVDTFLKLGVPLMDSAMCKNKGDVLELIRDLPPVTHLLQSVCYQVNKVNQIATITLHLKRNLMALICRIETMLVFHNCQNALLFKNSDINDIQGEEIQFEIDV